MSVTRLIDITDDLSDVTWTASAQGDLAYRGASGNWNNLPAGPVGTVLRSGGAGANPTWGPGQTYLGTGNSLNREAATGISGYQGMTDSYWSVASTTSYAGLGYDGVSALNGSMNVAVPDNDPANASLYGVSGRATYAGGNSSIGVSGVRGFAQHKGSQGQLRGGDFKTVGTGTPAGGGLTLIGVRFDSWWQGVSGAGNSGTALNGLAGLVYANGGPIGSVYGLNMTCYASTQVTTLKGFNVQISGAATGITTAYGSHLIHTLTNPAATSYGLKLEGWGVAGGYALHSDGGAVLLNLGLPGNSVGVVGAATPTADHFYVQLAGGTKALRVDPSGYVLTGGRLGNGQSAPTYQYHQLGGGGRVQILSTPAAPTVTPTGAAGAATYTYYVVAIDALGNKTVAGASTTTNTGNAALSGVNYNALSWAAVAGAVSYDVIRSAGGATQGSIALAQAGTTLNDTGLAASAYTNPTRNGTADWTVDGLLTVGGSYPNGANVTVNHGSGSLDGITLNNNAAGVSMTIRAYSGNSLYLTGTGGFLAYKWTSPFDTTSLGYASGLLTLSGGGAMVYAKTGSGANDQSQDVLRIQPSGAFSTYYRGLALYAKSNDTSPRLWTDLNTALTAQGGLTAGGFGPIAYKSNSGLVLTPTAAGSLAGGTYYYVITAVDYTGGETAYFRGTSVAVDGVTNKSVSLAWNAVTNAVSYRIYRSTSAWGGTWTQFSSNTNSYTDGGGVGTAASPPGLSTAAGQITGNAGINVQTSEGQNVLKVVQDTVGANYANAPNAIQLGPYLTFSSGDSTGGNSAKLLVNSASLFVVGQASATTFNFYGIYSDSQNITLQPNSYRLGIMSSGSSYVTSLYPGVADGAAAQAYVLDTLNTLANASAQLFTLNNHGAAKLQVLASGETYHSALASATVDANLWNGSFSVYLDEVGGNVKIRVKTSTGVLKTATLAMV